MQLFECVEKQYERPLNSDESKTVRKTLAVFARISVRSELRTQGPFMIRTFLNTSSGQSH